MDPKALVIPGTIEHTLDARSDEALRAEVTAHLESHPGARFVADVLRALHAPGSPLRSADAFFGKFRPPVLMDALERRPDLRARVAHGLTGSPLTLSRRIPAADLSTLIELLYTEDLPGEERSVRAPEDRGSTVAEIYLKYLDAADLAAYLPPRDVWSYESSDSWWNTPGDAERKLMAAEIKSLRRHGILSDSDLLDQIGNESLERDVPLAVRVEIRAAARKLGAEGKPFTDTAMIDAVRSADGASDLIDELVGCIPLDRLRTIVMRAAESIGLTGSSASSATSAAANKVTPSAKKSPSLFPPAAAPGASATASTRPGPMNTGTAAARTSGTGAASGGGSNRGSIPPARMDSTPPPSRGRSAGGTPSTRPPALSPAAPAEGDPQPEVLGEDAYQDYESTPGMPIIRPSGRPR